MGYTVSLASAASQNEGNDAGSPTTFVFNLTRDAGDANETSYRYEIRHATTFTLANTATAENPVVPDFLSDNTTFTWNAGELTRQITITATADTAIEGSESFSVWFWRNSVNQLFNSSSTITLVNDDTGPPVWSTAANFSAIENSTTVGTVAATGNGAVAYSLVGGADQAQFTINSSTGALTWTANNFEAPDDANTDGVYVVTVRATASGATTDRTFNITLSNENEPVAITSNGGGDSATITVAENSTAAVTTGTRSDPDLANGGVDPVTWSLSGTDAGAFNVDPNSGVLTFVSPPNFEAKSSYAVNLVATDSGGATDSQALTINITNQQDAPVITSNGGLGLAVVHVQENSTAVTTVVATDDDGDTRTYTKNGGADAALFTLDATTGVLTFTGAPNYEAPLDANGDNLYEVTVRATSTGGTDDQTLYVFVDNVIEPGVPTDVQGPGSGNTGTNNPNGFGGTSAPDYLTGTDGADSRGGGDGDDTIDGGNGDDQIDGDNGNDQLFGGSGNDYIRGLADNDQVYGGEGADDVNGNTGSDTVDGGAGDDIYVRGGMDNDVVYGGDGNDAHVNGNIGNDEVHGDAGNDTVYGGQGSDTVYGDTGDDRLSGDLGNDILYGGQGADRFAFAGGGGIDWVGDFNYAEGDRILLAPGTAYTMVAVSGQITVNLGNGEYIGLAGSNAADFNASWVVFG